MKDIYGYVNGKAVYTRDEFIFESRHFGPIKSDEDLINFSLKMAGKSKLIDMWLGDYALDHPKCDLTNDEYKRLKELQRQAIEEAKRADETREWRYVRTECFADNSEEEVWVDKDGIEKRVMTVYPHGDIC